MALLIGHQTSYLQVAGSSPRGASPHSGLGKGACTCVPVLLTSIIWYRPIGSDAFRLLRLSRAWRKVICPVYPVCADCQETGVSSEPNAR